MRIRSLTRDSAFQTAFLAVSHLVSDGAPGRLGVFGEVSAPARAFARELESDDRSVRAQALARELEKVARALEQRRLG